MSSLLSLAYAGPLVSLPVERTPLSEVQITSSIHIFELCMVIFMVIFMLLYVGDMINYIMVVVFSRYRV